MNAQDYKAAIEALTEQAWKDGYYLRIENKCGGCCSDFVAHLVRLGHESTTDPVEVDL